MAEQVTAKLFDSSKQFEIPTIDGKRCIVRFPSDQEWCQRVRSQKTIRQNLGRGKSKYEEGNARKVDAELFAKIRVDADGAEFDEYEAASVINRLDKAEITSVERAGSQYVIALKVPGARTTHTLKIPSEKKSAEFSAASGTTIHGERSSEIRVYLDPAGPFYDSLEPKTEGYAGAVPINHKLAVLRAMLSDIYAGLEEEDPED